MPKQLVNAECFRVKLKTENSIGLLATFWKSNLRKGSKKY